MKNISYYILIILVLISIPTATVAIIDEVNPLMGFCSFVIADLPEEPGIIEGCKCNGTKLQLSGDGLFSKPCQCGLDCKCKKIESSKPKKPEGQSIKEGDCDVIRSMYPVDSPYRKFLPKSKGKELWCLSTSESWCLPCNLTKHELVKMDKTGWTIDRAGTLETKGNFHIRLIDFERFEGFPSYFFEVQKDKNGNIEMNHDGTQKENVSLPTWVLWDEGKVKVVHKGFLNSFGLRKLWDGKDLIKGTDDVATP